VSAWRLTAHRLGDDVVLGLELLTREGWAPWHDPLPVRVGDGREAWRAAVHVSAASAGAVSRGRVLAAIRFAEQWPAPMRHRSRLKAAA
jgi:hypothetical protein